VPETKGALFSRQNDSLMSSVAAFGTVAVIGRLRDECLNQHWFLSLDEARAVTEAWRDDYNRVRPHGALGNRTPSEFARPVVGHAQLPALHG
jgi:transposase InsO family protein